MKSYTDLVQSKKLAKILPLESADMKILPFTEREYRIVPINDIAVCGRDDEIYAWSLAALLEEIPEIINFDDDESDYALEILKESDLYYLSYGNPLEGDKLNIEPQENFVDACYEMILKLYELNLL